MKLSEFMKVDVDNIWEACENHLGALEYFTRDLPEVEYQYALQKLKLEKLVAELDKQIREEAVSAGLKLTEKAIDSSIKRNEQYLQECKKLLELKKKLDELKRIRMLFEHRRDMIGNIVKIMAASGVEVGSVDRMKRILAKWDASSPYLQEDE